MSGGVAAAIDAPETRPAVAASSHAMMPPVGVQLLGGTLMLDPGDGSLRFGKGRGEGTAELAAVEFRVLGLCCL